MNKPLLSRTHRAFVFVLLLIAGLSCQTNDDTVAIPKTIADQILEDNQFSLLRAAVTYAEVGDALKGANLTLFAPNDAAFQASGLTEAGIRALPKEQVKNIVLYHVLYSSIGSSAIPSGQNSVQTATNGVAFINKSDNIIRVNNAQIVQADLSTANGYIHVINRVLSPSNGSLLATIQNNPDLTLLSAAVRRVASTNPTLSAALSTTASTNTVTVFAPNDAAFRSDSRYSTVTAIEAANPQTLANILSYHIITGIVFSNQLQSGSVNTLLSGSRLTISATNGNATVKGNRNSTAATIKTPDLVANNGVVHVIDQLLQP
ncbi:fasciclin domain-containing protein [Spirosoma soli]|uniref:Fasciclin domain-containing protein n=1 Tax=Spirosoma soli TaxID=1770529 RepID=A0ABW5M4C9_9BACT